VLLCVFEFVRSPVVSSLQLCDDDAADAAAASQVAGTVGGSTYGVAKQATLVAVRVLDCSGSGTTATVISGINWVVADPSTPVRRSCVVCHDDCRLLSMCMSLMLSAWRGVTRCRTRRR